MRKIRNINGIIIWVSFIIDVAIIEASYFFSVWARYSIFKGIDNANVYGARMVGFSFAYAFIVSNVLLLQKVHSPLDLYKKDGISVILLTNLAGIIGLVFFFYVSHINDFSRVALFFFGAISSLLLVGFYCLEKITAARYWDRIALKKQVIIVGNGETAQKYVKGIEQQKLPLLYVSGYVGYEKNGLGERLGNYEDLESVLEEYNPDELVVALEPHETQYMDNVMTIAEKEGIEIHLVPFFNEYMPKHPVMDVVGDVTLINLRSAPLNKGVNAFIKRVVDIAASFALIVLLCPLMLFTAVGVWASSPGPIFFCQERVGLGKRIFKMYKFRSMRVNEKEQSGWTTENDPRRTKFGAFIRKYSIDELPQLFNVLKGDMSLVGPRPEVPFYVRQFKETVPLYLVRQQVRPGMTGWAQVHGLRGDTSIEARVKYDIWYIENWSLMLDIRILFMTLFGGFINNES